MAEPLSLRSQFKIQPFAKSGGSAALHKIVRNCFKTSPRAQSLCWTETVNPRNILDMDACPDFFNRGGWPPQSAFLSRWVLAGDLKPD